MTFDKQRETLTKYHANIPANKWLEKEQGRPESIDGLPVRRTERYIPGQA